MRARTSLVAAALLLTGAIAVHPSAQAPAPQTPPPQAPPAQAPPAAPAQGPAQGRGGRGRGGIFPAQQRPPADPAVVERGKSIYEATCRACHGPDLRGGDMGGPNLLRSQLALNDQNGELIGPVIQNGRQTPGLPAMPPIPMPEADRKAVAAYIHSVQAQARGQGAPPPGEAVELDIVVGDAAAGKAYFDAHCSTCHSASGDLGGIATKVAEPMILQNLWVAGGRGRGGSGKPVMATVALPSGEKVTGRLGRIDEFIVVLEMEDGSTRSFRRDGDTPAVTIDDPLAGHRKLWQTLTNKDMHDVTAYLVTLK